MGGNQSVKQIVNYFLWTGLAILLGVGYMQCILGFNQLSSEGLTYLLQLFYHWGIIYVGLTIGLITALLFILVDVFWLKGKQKKNAVPTRYRLGIFLSSFVLVIITHYLLEKVIDVI